MLFNGEQCFCGHQGQCSFTLTKLHWD